MRNFVRSTKAGLFLLGVFVGQGDLSFAQTSAALGTGLGETFADSSHAPILLKSTHLSSSPTGVSRRIGPSSVSTADNHGDHTAPEGFCCHEPKFFTAMGEIIGLQVIPNYFNRRVSDDSSAVLTPDSWLHNMKIGFEWDNNGFTTNMFAHPYHGNLFYNSGRSNGYNFWSSALFAASGSFLWEMYGENNSAAINDWIATTLGGIMIGETLHRTAKLVRSNEDAGVTRSLREFAAFFIDPVGSFNRVARGEASKTGDNPTDRFPDAGMIQITAGSRAIDADDPFDIADTLGFDGLNPYVDIVVQYGDWFRGYETPYSSFQFALQINLSDKTPIGLMNIDGTLWGMNIAKDPRSLHTVSVNQRFMYVQNNAVEFGGPFFGATLNSGFRLNDSFRLTTRVQPMFAIMTGINAEFEDVLGRDYDFGTGAAANLFATLFYRDFPVVRLGYLGVFSATVNGAKGHHVIQAPFAQFRWRIVGDFGIGFDYLLWDRRSYYDNQGDFKTSVPTFRINLNLSLLDKIHW